MGIIADGIKSADDTTYGRSCNDVDGDARLLQHFQHTDMCHTFCATSTEYDTYFFSDLRAGLLTCHSRTVLLSIHHGTHQQGNRQKKHFSHIFFLFYGAKVLRNIHFEMFIFSKNIIKFSQLAINITIRTLFCRY